MRAGTKGERLVRLAVVLEGGGAKGAYQVGALKALEDAADVEIVAISGASIGAINAVFFSRADVQQLEILWRGIRRRDVLKFSRSAAVMPPAALLVGVVFVANVAAWNIHTVLALIASYRYARSRISGRVALWHVLFGYLIARPIVKYTRLPVHLDERIIQWSAKFPLKVSLMSSKPLRQLIDDHLPPTDLRSIPAYVSIAEYGPVFDPDYPGFRWWRQFGQDYLDVLDPVGFVFLRPSYVETRGLPKPEVADAVQQSAALPGLFPAAAGKGLISTDGGTIDNAPIAPLLDTEAERILVVHLGRKMSRIIAARRGLRAKYRFHTLDSIAAETLHRRWLRWAADDARPSPWRGSRLIRTSEMPPGPPQPSLLPEAVLTGPFAPIHHLRPKDSLGTFLTGTLNFSGPKIKRLIAQGERDTNELLNIMRDSPINPHTDHDLDAIPRFTGTVDRLVYIVRILIRSRLPRWYSGHSYQD
jgi:predicted acylesterase/phospholipase RssA